MNKDRLLVIAPHYLAMLLLVFLVLTVVRVAVGDVGFWVELAIVIVVAFAYRPLVVRLGIAPADWS